MDRITKRIGDIASLEYKQGLMIIQFTQGDSIRAKCERDVYRKVDSLRSDYLIGLFKENKTGDFFDSVYDDFLESRKNKVHPRVTCANLDINRKHFSELVDYTATVRGEFTEKEDRYIGDRLGVLSRTEIAYYLNRECEEVSSRMKVIAKRLNKSVDNI